METNQKKASVILSSYNAKDRLFLALSSYKHQDFPKEQFEVIVVDDGSKDETFKLIDQIDIDFSLKYIRHPNNLGRACARNSGIAEASGEVIIFSDSDMIAEPTFISKHVLHHEKNNEIFVGGSFWNKIDQRYNEQKGEYTPPITPEEIMHEKFFDASTKQPFAQHYERYLNQYGSNLNGFEFPWMYFIVMNCSVKSKHVKQIGLFDEQFQRRYGGEDEEMGYRLWKGGLKGIVDPSIKNHHQEHKRFGNQGSDSNQSINYIIQKHQDLNPIMYYHIHFVDLIEKSRLLQDIQRAIQEKVVSLSFEQNCLNEFLLYSQGITTRTSSSYYLKKDIRRLQIKKQYRQLVFFLHQLIFSNKKWRRS
ncbi:glycosyltransferase [Metabacillus elymi]|uniref:Glycosyltransferase n=1 Tax=Metabacillus elymi TaxID=2745198 RepID=A0ABX6S6K6_9BACI|nr:glycosyltransferase [Metabacillus sp. KUDC1714]QNF28486.1 glycosyltransferase [Metabacillus sp. KUDC1714]